MTPLHLMTDEDRLECAAPAPEACTLGEQLLYTAVLQLMRDVTRLKKKVADLEGRERV